MKKSRTVGKTMLNSILVAALVVALSPVQAQQSSSGSGTQSADQNPSDTESRIVISGNDKLRLTLSGQINRGVLFFDDGEETGSIHVDNDNSSTRIRLGAESINTGELKFGGLIELQFESNSTASVDQENQSNVGPNSFTERKLELYGEHTKYGRITVGQGDTASNGTSEEDLSGTTVIGYSGISFMAGGLRFRDNLKTLTDITVGSAFSNLDGLSRDDRLRYDTPNIVGVVVSVSAIADELWDVAIRYSGDASSFKTRAALSYADVGEELDNRINGSVSVLHSSGFSVTVAAGQDDRTDNRDPEFGYIKAGYQTNWNTLGTTAISIDYYDGDDVASIDDQSTSVGFLVVQNIESFGSELYAGLRNYELDVGATSAQLDDVLATLVGVRVKF